MINCWSKRRIINHGKVYRWRGSLSIIRLYGHTIEAHIKAYGRTMSEVEVNPTSAQFEHQVLTTAGGWATEGWSNRDC